MNMKKTQLNTIEAAKENCKRKLFSFNKALKSLKEVYSFYIKKPDQKISQMALIKSFELAFELSWKTLQSFFKSQGYMEVNSPKGIIKEAFNKEVIQDGQIWIDMLDARNRLSHIYDESIFKGIIKKISKEYVQEIEKLYQKLKKEIQ